MTIWALVVALAICELCLECVYNYRRLEADERFRNVAVVYVIPIGMIQAITNRQIGLKYVATFCDGDDACLVFPNVVFYSVISELIVGFMIPGTSSIRTINTGRFDLVDGVGKPIAMMMYVVSPVSVCLYKPGFFSDLRLFPA